MIVYLDPEAEVTRLEQSDKIESAIPRFCVDRREGLPKMLDFGYLVLIWWQIDEQQEILKQSYKDLFI